MVTREVVVIPGDGIGREVIPLATGLLRAVCPDVRLIAAEAGAGHARRTGLAVDPLAVEQVRLAGSALMGPEAALPPGIPSAFATLRRALDLYAVLYHLQDPARALDLLLIIALGADERGRASLSPAAAWAATRLGNLAASLSQGRARSVAIAHDSELAFAHAVAGGVGNAATVERLDAIFLTNSLDLLLPDLNLLVVSAPTGALLLPPLSRAIQPLEATGCLLLGAEAVIAMPAHGPLKEQIGWGFANPMGAVRAVIALLRYGWSDEAGAARLEAAVSRALSRRRTPDMQGLHSMYEVARAITQELARLP